MNNWFVIAGGFEAVTSSWARIYFVVWWIISYLVGVNIFVALVLESFVKSADRKTELLIEHEEENMKLTITDRVTLYEIAD